MKATTHDSGQKLQISFLFVLGQNGPWSSAWWLCSNKIMQNKIMYFK